MAANNPFTVNFDAIQKGAYKPLGTVDSPVANKKKPTANPFMQNFGAIEEANKPVSTLGTYGKTLWQGVKGIPAYVNAAVEGDQPYTKQDSTDKIIAENAANQQAFIESPGAESPVLGGFAKAREIRQGADSAAGTIASMAPAAAGAAYGSLFGPVGTAIGGIAGAGLGLYGMKRYDENQFIRQNIDKANAEREANKQLPLNQQEAVNLQNQLVASGDPQTHGLWEAGSELGGTALELGIALSPLKKAAGLLKPIASPLLRAGTVGLGKALGIGGTEVGEELLTNVGQNPIAKKYGMPEATAGETAKQTALQMLPLSVLGGVHGAVQGYRYQTPPPIPATVPPPGPLTRAAEQSPVIPLGEISGTETPLQQPSGTNGQPPQREQPLTGTGTINQPTVGSPAPAGTPSKGLGRKAVKPSQEPFTTQPDTRTSQQQVLTPPSQEAPKPTEKPNGEVKGQNATETTKTSLLEPPAPEPKNLGAGTFTPTHKDNEDGQLLMQFDEPSKGLYIDEQQHADLMAGKDITPWGFEPDQLEPIAHETAPGTEKIAPAQPVPPRTGATTSGTEKVNKAIPAELVGTAQEMVDGLTTPEVNLSEKTKTPDQVQAKQEAPAPIIETPRATEGLKIGDKVIEQGITGTVTEEINGKKKVVWEQDPNHKGPQVSVSVRPDEDFTKLTQKQPSIPASIQTTATSVEAPQHAVNKDNFALNKQGQPLTNTTENAAHNTIRLYKTLNPVDYKPVQIEKGGKWYIQKQATTEESLAAQPTPKTPVTFKSGDKVNVSFADHVAPMEVIGKPFIPAGMKGNKEPHVQVKFTENGRNGQVNIPVSRVTEAANTKPTETVGKAVKVGDVIDLHNYKIKVLEYPVMNMPTGTPGIIIQNTHITDGKGGWKENNSKPYNLTVGEFIRRTGKAPITEQAHTQPKETKAEAKPKRNPKALNDSDDLLTHIAKLGGLSATEARTQGIDTAAFKTRGKGGILRVFHNGTGAQSFDGMAETLRQYHFATPTANSLLEQVSKSINQGIPVYNAIGYESIAKIAAEEKFNEETAQHTFDLESLLSKTNEHDPGSVSAIEKLIEQGKITPENINEYWSELNDFIDSRDTGSIKGGASEIQKEQGLASYTESELKDRERAAKQRAKQAAEAELKAKGKEAADKEVETLADEMLGNIGTNDVFGNAPLTNLGKAEKPVKTEAGAEDLATLKQQLSKVEAEYRGQGMVKNAITGHQIDNLKKRIANIEYPELAAVFPNHPDLPERINNTIKINAQDDWKDSLQKTRQVKQYVYKALKDYGFTDEYAENDAGKAVNALTIGTKAIEPTEAKAPEVKAEQLASYTRINGAIERDAATRLEQLLNVLPSFNDKARSSEWHARRNIHSVIDELRKEKFVGNPEGILASASSALLNQHGPASEVIDEVIEQLQGKVVTTKTPETKLPVQPKTPTKETTEPVRTPEYIKAQKDLEEALGDLGEVFLSANLFAKKAVPTELSTKDLIPVLTRVMDAAFRMGYATFKANARFVIDTIRNKFGDPAADSITIDHLQGSYIAMGKGTTSKKEVVNIESLDELTEAVPETGKTAIETAQPARFKLAKNLADLFKRDGEITSKTLTSEADKAFGGTQANGMYSGKDAYDAMETAINLYLLDTEASDWNTQNAAAASNTAKKLTNLIKALPTQTRRDAEMDEYQQFSTPPALSFVANWVANVQKSDHILEPSAGTGDLAIWPQIAGAKISLNELSTRRAELLKQLFPEATVLTENAEQLNNVLPKELIPSVIVMNPPFSSTAGRVAGQRNTMNGAKHIEQALLRLEDNGRLVAIVGNGMAHDKPAFKAWWKNIEKKYNVRANIGISGKEYSKYGTTFDNQILVIDKNGSTTAPVMTGKVESVAELPKLLEGIKNDRKLFATESVAGMPEIGASAKEKQDTLQQENGTGTTALDTGGIKSGQAGNGGITGTGTVDSGLATKAPTGDQAFNAERSGGDTTGLLGQPANEPGRSGSGTVAGVSKQPERDKITIDSVKKAKSSFTDSIFSNYSPQRLSIPGSKKHPGKLVQSSAMASVEPPAPTYRPVLPKEVITQGLLSDAQLEAVVYAGQAHAQMLPDGKTRKGFFIGDGTGVGKGREISGIILDNMKQGRKKALWVSFNEGLLNDAKRDFSGIGGEPSQLFFQGKTKPANAILQKNGVLFTSYSTLSNGEKKQATDLGQKEGQSRLQQIIDWLGEDFDGVIAFDEAHSMGNSIAIKGKRGFKKPSKQALSGIELQARLPNARIVYVSATGATEISNLGYASRLGLWGEGTPFANTQEFINEVSQGGVAAMELLSRDMKALGMYIARSLSYDGVTYERMEHQLTPLQNDIYNELSRAWQTVLQNVNAALAITNGEHSGGAKSAAMSAFWGSHQRFFNQIITSMQTPTVIDDIQKQLDKGNVAVIQIVNTNEAAQERNIATSIANGEELEELDFTPRQMLMDYIRNGFPVQAYQQATDDNGNIVYVPVVDSEGKPVFDNEAIALRDNLLKTLEQIRVPENPLDSIISVFGSEQVAEVTGRGRRFVQTLDKNGALKVVEEKRNKQSARNDADAFQNDKKKILIFSGAGGTGYSFHADNAAINQRKRIHYILQPGWRADSAVQGFGRTHRTNQAIEPHYVLPTTNLKAQKRFVSSIARRLDQLGALTKGERKATGQGLFTASDNLESEYARTGLYNFFVDLEKGGTPLDFGEVTQQMGLNLRDEHGNFSTDKIPEIPQFLNRLLSLTSDMQDKVFDEFEKRLIEAVDYAKERGTYDMGLQTLTAKRIEKTRDEVVYEDTKTGANARYIELGVTHDINYNAWKETEEYAKSLGEKGGFYQWEDGRNKGKVFLLQDIGSRPTANGTMVERSKLTNIRAGSGSYRDDTNELKQGYAYKHHEGRYQKVTITKKLTVDEAKALWNEQIDAAPIEETITNHMLVGVILPIWDRVKGTSKIYRLETDTGEQLLGKLMSDKDAKSTLTNLGIGSTVSTMPKESQLEAIKKGARAVLSNGWSIENARVNNENRIEIKPTYLSSAEGEILKNQGAFHERISWNDRYFIPNGENGIDVFKRITESKPVVELFNKEGTAIHEPETTYQTDLFGNPVPTATRTPARRVTKPEGRSGTGIPDNITPQGKFATKTVIASEKIRDIGIANITTPEALAQATHYLGKSAVEHFDAIVTDKDGKPLAIVGSFKGTIDSSSVYPLTVATEAFRIKGAAHIWFSHNHPSGTANLSTSDIMIARKLQAAFDGSKIKAHGIAVVTFDGKWSYENPSKNTTAGGSLVKQAGVSTKVPVLERIIKDNDNLYDVAITSPERAKTIIPNIAGDETGLALLNAQHYVTAFVPLNPLQAALLKNNGRMDNLYRALSVSNAARAMLYDPRDEFAVATFQNIGTFLRGVDIDLMDVLKGTDVSVQSVKERDISLTSPGGVFYRKTAAAIITHSDYSLLASNAQPKGISEKQATLALKLFQRDLKGIKGVTFKIYANPQEAFGNDYTATGRVKGFYTYQNGHNTIGIFRDSLDSVQDTLTTLQHETLAHFGLNLFTPKEKMAFLHTIIVAQKGREVGELFAQVRHDYPDLANDEFKQAEEVFARIAEENEQGRFQTLFDRLLALLMPLLRKAGIIKGYVSKAELRGMVKAISSNIRRGAQQQTFPKDSQAQFSAVGNTGEFSPESNDIRYSIRADYTPEAEKVKNEMIADRTLAKLTPRQRFDKAKNLWATKINQSLFDRYRSLLDVLHDPTAWMMGRLSGNTGGIVEKAIDTGHPMLDPSGAIDIDTSKKSLMAAAEPLQGEIDDAMLWMAALRAEKENTKAATAQAKQLTLKAEIKSIGLEIRSMIYNAKTGSETISAEGAKRVRDLQKLLKMKQQDRIAQIKRAGIRERYITPERIVALKTITQGTLPDGQNRADVYEQFRQDYEALNNAIVKIAVDTGTIDRDEADRWSNEGFYVPFFRFLADESSSGPKTMDSLANNTAYQHYKGSAKPLDDLLVNVIGNWHHLVDSGLKNQAATQAVKSAVAMGLMEKVESKIVGNTLAGKPVYSTPESDLFIRENGKKIDYRLIDPHKDEGKLVLESLLSMNYSGLNNIFMTGATKASSLLRFGVVANPAFKARNLIRDTLQALAAVNVGYNPLTNVYQGWNATKPDNKTIARMIASGGAFGDSGYLFMADSEAMLKQIKRDMQDPSVLNTKDKILKVWDIYQDFGARLENVNRAVAFEKTLKETGNLLKAANEANDLLAFQSHGSSKALYELSRTVPFLNAGLQGMDKMIRSAGNKDTAKRFWTVTSMYMAASVVLALGMAGDDDYDQAEEFDKETYHLFKIPGSDTLYKLPRPFEIGAMASIAERIAQQLVADSPNPKFAAERIINILGSQMRLNPVPQIVRPVLEIWANKSFFTGRDIESQGLQYKQKSERGYARTALPAKGIASSLSIFGEDTPITSRSPVEIEHLVTAYAGWLGAFTLSGTDAILRPLLGETAPSGLATTPFLGQAAADLKRAFMADSSPRNTAFTTAFYDNLKTLESVSSALRTAREDHDVSRIEEIKNQYGKKVGYVTAYRRASRTMSLLNKLVEKTWDSSTLSADAKSERIDSLNKKRTDLAKKTVMSLGLD